MLSRPSPHRIFAPLAFWWTGTMVPSTRAYSKSGSSDRHAKTRSTTPPFTQRRKRWKTLFQLPKSLGKSRQGTPVRPRHSTASRNSRLSLAVAPGSEGLPGSSGAIFSQTASPTMNRDLSSIAPTPPKGPLKPDPAGGGILNINRPYYITEIISAFDLIAVQEVNRDLAA